MWTMLLKFISFLEYTPLLACYLPQTSSHRCLELYNSVMFSLQLEDSL
jgi:hypothetical protein